jgi:hypothetical protein
MHEPDESELADYRRDAMEAAHVRRMRERHSYRPDCGCWSCEPEKDDEEESEDES